MATSTPLPRTFGARTPHRPGAVPRPATGVLAGLAGLALLTVVTAAGADGPGTTLSPAPRGAAEPCVAPAAVAALAAWPTVAAPAADDQAEGRGERRPDALVVPPEFRAFQDCRQRNGG